MPGPIPTCWWEHRAILDSSPLFQRQLSWMYGRVVVDWLNCIMHDLTWGRATGTRSNQTLSAKGSSLKEELTAILYLAWPGCKVLKPGGGVECQRGEVQDWKG